MEASRCQKPTSPGHRVIIIVILIGLCHFHDPLVCHLPYFSPYLHHILISSLSGEPHAPRSIMKYGTSTLRRYMYASASHQPSRLSPTLVCHWSTLGRSLSTTNQTRQSKCRKRLFWLLETGTPQRSGFFRVLASTILQPSSWRSCGDVRRLTGPVEPSGCIAPALHLPPNPPRCLPRALLAAWHVIPL